MFRKILLYITALIAIALYMLSENESFMRYFTNKLATSETKGFKLDTYMYGDLYAMSFLKDYKIPLHGLADSVHKAADTAKVNDLWIIGDSYLTAITPELVDTVMHKTHLKYYYYPNVEAGNVEHISFNTGTGRKKILLIERTERFLRDEFLQTKTMEKYLKFYQVDTSKAPVIAEERAPQINSMNLGAKAKMNPLKFKWNKPGIINQNLETMMFGYGIFTPIKEWKAGFNYSLFGRTSDKVYAAPDKFNLYFTETIDSTKDYSSFKPLSDQQVDSIVMNMNLLAAYYKKAGFDEVVFSFIPNAVTICDPELGTYNNMIPRVEGNSLRQFNVINVYNAYRKESNPKSLYRRSDTHWNAKGFALWIDQVNGYLQAASAK